MYQPLHFATLLSRVSVVFVGTLVEPIQSFEPQPARGEECVVEVAHYEVQEQLYGAERHPLEPGQRVMIPLENASRKVEVSRIEAMGGDMEQPEYLQYEGFEGSQALGYRGGPAPRIVYVGDGFLLDRERLGEDSLEFKDQIVAALSQR